MGNSKDSRNLKLAVHGGESRKSDTLRHLSEPPSQTQSSHLGVSPGGISHTLEHGRTLVLPWLCFLISSPLALEYMCANDSGGGHRGARGAQLHVRKCSAFMRWHQSLCFYFLSWKNDDFLKNLVTEWITFWEQRWTNRTLTYAADFTDFDRFLAFPTATQVPPGDPVGIKSGQCVGSCDSMDSFNPLLLSPLLGASL